MVLLMQKPYNANITIKIIHKKCLFYVFFFVFFSDCPIRKSEALETNGKLGTLIVAIEYVKCAD